MFVLLSPQEANLKAKFTEFTQMWINNTVSKCIKKLVDIAIILLEKYCELQFTEAVTMSSNTSSTDCHTGFLATFNVVPKWLLNMLPCCSPNLVKVTRQQACKHTWSWLMFVQEIALKHCELAVFQKVRMLSTVSCNRETLMQTFCQTFKSLLEKRQSVRKI